MSVKDTRPCKQCGAEIVFRPHPTDRSKKAPYNPVNGELHWKVCSGRSDGVVYSKLSSIPRCRTCNSGAKFVYWKTTAAGVRVLNVACRRLHWMGALRSRAEHAALINITEDAFDDLKNEQYGKSLR